MSDVQQIIAARNALGADLQNAADLSTQLNAKLHHAHDALTQLEVLATQLHDAAAGRITAFDSRLRDQAALVADGVTALAGHATDAHTAFAEAIAHAHTGWDQLHQGVAALTERGHALSETVSNVALRTDSESQAVTAAGQSEAQAIAGIGDAASGEIGLADGHMHNHATEWDALLGTVSSALAQGNAQIEQAIQQHLHDELSGISDGFQQALDLLARDTVAHAMTDLQQQIEGKMRETLAHVADQAIGELQGAADEMIHKIVSAKDMTDAERQLMDKLIEPIEPMIHDFIQEVMTVEGIADAVGIGLR